MGIAVQPIYAPNQPVPQVLAGLLAANAQDKQPIRALTLDDLRQYGTNDCHFYRQRIISRHPGLSKVLINLYARTAEKSGFVAANAEIRETEATLKIGRTGLYADCSDGQIIDYCKVKSRNIKRDFTELVQRFSGMEPGDKNAKSTPGALTMGIEWAREQVEKTGAVFPLADRHIDNREKELSAIARICDEVWWRRQIRTIAARKLEQFHRAHGMVHRGAGVYVSNTGLVRRGWQVKRNRDLLGLLEAVSNEGDRVNLADAADASVSNLANRRNELMTRMRGSDEVAASMGFVSIFFTISCPSKYHAVLSKSGKTNSNYNQSTPKEAQDYLCGVWGRIRADWHRTGVRCFGFRIAEPHHDGTPHWHLVLHMSWEHAAEAIVSFGDYAMDESPSERGADKHRWDYKLLKPGQATGYLAKYIAKNIDGYQVATDDEAQLPGPVGAARVGTWAGIWGIRQFQAIGNVSVTVWRELRKLREPLEGQSVDEWEKIRLAADEGDWAGFVQLMGGALVPRDAQTIRALMITDDGVNKYNEVIERIRGLVMRVASRAARTLITRHKTWTIQRIVERSEGITGPPPCGPLDLCQ